MAITQKSRWDDVGQEPPAGDAKYVAGEQPIAEYDNWFNKAVADDISAINAWLDNLGIEKVYIDTSANKPTSGKTTELFIETDTNKIYRGTGDGWEALNSEDADTVDGLHGTQFLRKDVADTKTGDLTLAGILKPDADGTRDIGTSSAKFKDGYFSGTVYSGDVKFLNDWVITEKDDEGNILKNCIRILNSKNEEIFRISEDGLYFKGKKIVGDDV